MSTLKDKSKKENCKRSALLSLKRIQIKICERLKCVLICYLWYFLLVSPLEWAAVKLWNEKNLSSCLSGEKKEKIRQRVPWSNFGSCQTNKFILKPHIANLGKRKKPEEWMSDSMVMYLLVLSLSYIATMQVWTEIKTSGHQGSCTHVKVTKLLWCLTTVVAATKSERISNENHVTVSESEKLGRLDINKMSVPLGHVDILLLTLHLNVPLRWWIAH